MLEFFSATWTLIACLFITVILIILGVGLVTTVCYVIDDWLHGKDSIRPKKKEGATNSVKDRCWTGTGGVRHEV